MKSRKRRLVAAPSVKQQPFYVMPDPPESDGVPDLSESRFVDLDTALIGLQGLGDPLEDAILDERIRETDLSEWDLATALEKAAAPIIHEAIDADFLENIPHDSAGDAFDLSDHASDALKMLMLGVIVGLKSWRKQPEPEVIAAAVRLAVARVRNERDIKHPRDIAKEVSVRPKTLFAIRKLALSEIDRLGIADDLRALEGVTGTYNER